VNNNFEDNSDTDEKNITPQQDDSETLVDQTDESALQESIETSADESEDAGAHEEGQSATEPPGNPQPVQVPLDHSTRGRIAHFMGALVGAIIGKQIGALRPERFANRHLLDGIVFQIRTISGSQKTFTVNPATTPQWMIVAAKRIKESTENMNCYTLFGVQTVEALSLGRKSSSRGHIKSEHLQVSLSAVERVTLGEARIPRDLITAGTKEDRHDLLDAIDALVVGHGVMDETTIESVRAFIHDSDNEEASDVDGTKE
jgi:hypothetical protein